MLDLREIIETFAQPSGEQCEQRGRDMMADSITTSKQEDQTIYNVVVNHEEQYSIWLAGREMPPGWRAVGKQGPKDDCLAYIEEVWTDMRPLSVRKYREEGSVRGC